MSLLILRFCQQDVFYQMCQKYGK